MNSKKELQMEMTTLISERRIGELGIKAHQNALSEMLNGKMGEDIKEVLSGNRKVKLAFRQKLKYKIDNFLKLFSTNDEYYE